MTVQTGDGSHAPRVPRIKRRDRRGRGLRGVLAPADVPIHRSRAEHFDDLVLQAVARLEPRWEAQLAGIEFAVEEIPRAELGDPGAGPVPLARLDPGSAGPDLDGLDLGDLDLDDLNLGDLNLGGLDLSGLDLSGTAPGAADLPGWGMPDVTPPDVTPGVAPPGARPPGGPPPAGGGADTDSPGAVPPGGARPDFPPAKPGGAHRAGRDGALRRPPRIVLYRRPLLARADGDEELAELIFDVVVEEFARLVGVDPEDVDPGYDPDD